MVLQRDQAEKAVMKSMDFGYPAFMVQGYISKITQNLYGQGFALALQPVEAGYTKISGNEAVTVVINSAKAIGFNPNAQQQHQVANGVAKLNGLGYVFVRKTQG